MNQPRKPKKVKAPVDFMGYISNGKEYGIIKTREFYRIIDDFGVPIFISLKKCLHLGGQDWIVTEYEDEN